MTIRHDFTRPVWVLLYLHDWDVDGGIYPEIHGVYETDIAALVDQRTMSDPSKYHIRKAYYINAVSKVAA